MPTITTERGEEISVSRGLIAKLAERMHRMAPERRDALPRWGATPTCRWWPLTR